MHLRFVQVVTLTILVALVIITTPLHAQKLKDGETGVVSTSLSEAEATAKVKAYFNGKDINFTVNQDTGGIVSDWFGERRCGPGFYRCAERAVVRVAD